MASFDKTCNSRTDNSQPPEPPSLEEIAQLTRTQLVLEQSESDLDPIFECGRACITLLPLDPDTTLQVAHEHLQHVPYKDVRTCWRRLYTDAALRQALVVLEKQMQGEETALNGSKKQKVGSEGERGGEDWVTKLVRILDMALILTGAPRREELVELWFSALESVLKPEKQDGASGERASKRRKISLTESSRLYCPTTFPSHVPHPPVLKHPIQRHQDLDLVDFQMRTKNEKEQDAFIIEGHIGEWPALCDESRKWSKPSYLLEKTLGGRRLVPVEIGRSYTDEGWGQKIISFGEFMERYMFSSDLSTVTSRQNDTNDTPTAATAPASHHTATSPEPSPIPSQTGYLAQHDLFAQIPSLHSDIGIPEYVHSRPPFPDPNYSAVKELPELVDPLLNAWFGPAGTISPLHTDPYHNILAQVVGYKYVRLYRPIETKSMFPRGTDERGIDMSNTSEVDLDAAMGVWPEISCWERDSPGTERNNDQALDEEEAEEYEKKFKEFKNAHYVDAILGPGDCLYVPLGWWHYVRSLTPSFSVSFWFN